jgi:hypothetical protein
MTVNAMIQQTYRNDQLSALYSGGFADGLSRIAAPRKNPGLFAPQTDYGMGIRPMSRKNARSEETSSAVRESGGRLEVAMQGMAARGGNNLFQRVSALSSNNETATVRVDPMKMLSRQPERVTVEVMETARAQTNSGTVMARDGNAVATGQHNFAIDQGGRTHFFTVNVNSRDDNESVQKKMAQAIIARNIGVTATVTVDEKNKTSVLDLSSSRTGTVSSFTVRDTSGHITEKMGINQVTEDARNARFRVNESIETFSRSNELTVAPGVTATMTGPGKTEISFKQDTEAQVNAIKLLAESVNTALKSAKISDGGGSAKFINDIRGANKTFSQQLQRAGINVSNTGELSINEDKLRQAAEDGSLQRLFSNNANGTTGYGARLENIADRALKTDFYADTPVNYSLNRNNNADNQINLLNSLRNSMQNNFQMNFHTFGGGLNFMDMFA